MSTTTRRANLTRGFPFVLDEFFNLDYFPTSCCTPKAEINYEDDNVTLDLILAGTPKEDIKVEVKGKNLIIESTQKDKEIKKSYELPDDIDSENISAKYENGVLNIVLPKSVKDTKVIEIQ